ncbi:CPBP family intramembrane glutamic endopeptidase [Paenibacillus thermoaerophilus]|uniref:CPBP family intramembrane glutamic endopeptidase n=1 Tax=Paenibacillus thermoaerophilus TaxID=1215385 RepID=A0ABW2V2Q4_9BACL|nr:CPBP family intramembrane glutamic endopeptidase [Paenibacillus thermoaerophilus]TMV18734.1 CPBP family intramembrane metalloprotease [Paenibacillus thermoaerophilus]
MRKFDPRKWKLRRVTVNQIDDRTLLLNVYVTQALTLAIACVALLLQRRNPIEILKWPGGSEWIGWGLGLAGVVLAVDLAVARFVPEDVTDDGGINKRIFGRLPLWHIALLSLVVAVCEEMLFRGAVQHFAGPYWTSIVFAAIHVRYLRHWLMTGLVFSISYGLGVVQDWTGTIWAPIAAHFAIDFVMGCIIRYRREDDDDGQNSP